jgi:hypothetical protein
VSQRDDTRRYQIKYEARGISSISCFLKDKRYWLQVRSRFAEGTSETEDFSPFLSALEKLGFSKKAMDTTDSHFVIFEMQKTKDGNNEQSSWPELKPCIYKKR